MMQFRKRNRTEKTILKDLPQVAPFLFYSSLFARHLCTAEHTHRDISHIFLKSIRAISSSLCTVMSGQVYYSFYTDIFFFQRDVIDFTG